MEIYSHFLRTCLFTYVFIIADTEDVAWNVDTIEVKQGDTINLSCSVTDTGKFEIVRLLKTDDGLFDVNGDNENAVSDNGNIIGKFKESGRYTVTYKRHSSNRTSVVNLIILDAEGDDTGTLECFKRSKDVNSDLIKSKVELRVLVPLSDVYFTKSNSDNTTERVNENSSITLVENEENVFECRAIINGGLYPPSLKITIDGIDKSQLFYGHGRSGNGREKSNDLMKRSEANLRYSNSIPDIEMNGKLMQCIADTPGYNSMMVNAIIRIQYKPRVKCTKYKHFAPLGGMVQMECEAKSNPSSNITWQYGRKKKLLNIAEETSNVVIMEETEGDSTKQMLHISKVHKKHFGKFQFKAKNSLGTDSIPLTLSQTSKAKPPPPKQNPPKTEPKIIPSNSQTEKTDRKPEKMDAQVVLGSNSHSCSSQFIMVSMMCASSYIINSS